MNEFFVLTPTHSRCDRLKRAIESVRNQTYGNWTHYILDDGSSDETSAVLAEVAGDPRIRFWKFDENRGVNAARNYLLDRILETGQPGFVVILDDDDQLEPGALQGFDEGTRTYPEARWFIGNCRSPSGDPINHIRGNSRTLCYVRDHKLSNRLVGDVAHAFSTSIIGDIRFSSQFPNAEEWWFYSALAEKTPIYPLNFDAKIQEYLGGGLTLTRPNRAVAGQVYALKLERLDSFLSRSQRAELEARLGRHLNASGDWRGGAQNLWRAFRHWPFEYRIYVYGLKALRDRLRSGLSQSA